MASGHSSRAFSLIEVVISLLVVTILVSLLIPTLIYARDSARATVCAANLRQIGSAWQLYTSQFDAFPRYGSHPEWEYGGAAFRGVERSPYLAVDRPINRHLVEDDRLGNEQFALLFRCPADAGIYLRTSARRPGPSVLDRGGTCFAAFGTSYKANPYLLDAQFAGIEPRRRPLRIAEVQVSPSRLLLVGDPEWYYATRPAGNAESRLSANWHSSPRSGNFLALDNSVRFTTFTSLEDTYAIHPRQERGMK
jgi:type II secretory pathway pseudopilin PulG